MARKTVKKSEPHDEDVMALSTVLEEYVDVIERALEDQPEKIGTADFIDAVLEDYEEELEFLPRGRGRDRIIFACAYVAGIARGMEKTVKKLLEENGL